MRLTLLLACGLPHSRSPLRTETVTPGSVLRQEHSPCSQTTSTRPLAIAKQKGPMLESTGLCETHRVFASRSCSPKCLLRYRSLPQPFDLPDPRCHSQKDYIIPSHREQANRVMGQGSNVAEGRSQPPALCSWQVGDPAAHSRQSRTGSKRNSPPAPVCLAIPRGSERFGAGETCHSSFERIQYALATDSATHKALGTH